MAVYTRINKSDLSLIEKTFKIGKKLITKLWNAAKFLQLHLKEGQYDFNNIKNNINSGEIFYDLDLSCL